MDRPKKPVPAARGDELAFRGSPDTSLGVELELQILDRETGDLAPGAVAMLRACAEDTMPGVSAELMQSMVEVKTGVCHNVEEVRETLVPVLRRIRNIAGSLGYDLAMAGTHPFHRTSTSAVFPAERYERIMDRLAWLTYQRVVFGLHIHVGVPGGDEAMALSTLLVQYLPHLLALSANSPFWQGVDTGLQSSRAALYRLLPHAGVPRYFAKWRDFRTFCQVMRDCKTIQSFKDIYWDIRPRPDLGTIEFRICDMPPTLGTVLALTALTRCLVASSLQLLEKRPQLLRGDMRRHWIAVENKWLATRYGLAGMYVRTPAGKRRQLGQDVAALVGRLMPIARESGDHVFLAPLLRVDKFESGSARQRRIYREFGNWKAVIDDLTRQFSQDLGAAEPAPRPAPVP
jgi:carboxylate-amine ligase